LRIHPQSQRWLRVRFKPARARVWCAQLTSDVAIINTGLHYMDRRVETSYVSDMSVLKDFLEASRPMLPQLMWMESPPQVGGWGGLGCV
jgi:hypothetical protein